MLSNLRETKIIDRSVKLGALENPRMRWNLNVVGVRTPILTPQELKKLITINQYSQYGKI
jgi:hypothetical protein